MRKSLLAHLLQRNLAPPRHLLVCEPLESRTLLFSSNPLDPTNPDPASTIALSAPSLAALPAHTAERTWTTLTLPDTAITWGMPLTLAATVFSKYRPPSGNITFFDNQRELARSTVNSSGEARLVLPSSLSGGVHKLQAAFSGDNMLRPSTSKVVWLTVAPVSLNLYIDTPSTSVVQGQDVTLSPRFSAKKGLHGDLDGTVVFKDGKQVLAAVPMAQWDASFSTNLLAPGPHSLTAVYTGSANALPRASKPLKLTVNPATTVDLLIVYTAQARISAGGTDSFLAEIRNAVADTNNAFGNSRIAASIHLVAAQEVAYNESRFLGTDLDRLTDPHDGYLDSVQSLRNQYGADLVSLFVADGDDAGLGYKLMDRYNRGNADLGFTVVVTSYATAPEYVLAHELGHNFGATHDPQNSEGPGFAPDAYGYRFKIDNNVYHDIMAYDPGQIVPYFSNPDVTYLGVPVGSKTANVARVINETAPLVAAYRKPVTINLTPTLTTLAASANASAAGQSVTFTATVRPASGSVAGSVLFLDGNTSLGLVPLKRGLATLSTKSLSPGLHSLTAIFIGSDSFTLSDSPTLHHTVNTPKKHR
jgi:hypothetical protein